MEKQLLILRESSVLYGVFAEQVREVLPYAGCTPLPVALPCYEGICNYKGTMIPVFSLAQISKNRAQQAEKDRILVIMESDRGLVGLLVTEVLDVTDGTEEELVHDEINKDQDVLRILTVIRWREPVFVLDLEHILERVSSQDRKS